MQLLTVDQLHVTETGPEVHQTETKKVLSVVPIIKSAIATPPMPTVSWEDQNLSSFCVLSIMFNTAGSTTPALSRQPPRGHYIVMERRLLSRRNSAMESDQRHDAR